MTSIPMARTEPAELPAIPVPSERGQLIELLAAERPPRAGMASTTLTHATRALLRLRHRPDQLFEVTLFPLMLLVMFTYLFGGAVSGSTGDYLQYVLPGILVIAVLNTSTATGMALNTDIQKGVFDRFRSLPGWQPAPVVGALLADVVRYAVAATGLVLAGLALGFRPEAGFGGVVLAVLLVLAFSWSLSWVWASIGLVARSPESVMLLGMVVVFPLTFISNVFVDPETLPEPLQRVVEVNPVTHLAAASRGLMHGEPVGDHIGWVLLACAVLVVVFAPLTMRLYRRER